MRLSLLGCLVASLSVASFACASDPNKDAKNARDAELEAQREHRQDVAENRGDQRVGAAEAKRENTENTADHSGNSDATKDRVSADAKLTESREVYRAKASERLEKLDARTSELKTLLARAGAKATTKARDSMRTVETQRSSVTHDLEQLPKVSDDAFAGAKSHLDSQLDTLEGLVKKTAKDIDESKR
jgi:hypothetical protein